MSSFPKFLEERAITQLFANPEDQSYWLDAFNAVFNNQVDTWDYQWVYSVWTNNGLGVLPNYNLITNIGFDEAATHTKSKHLVCADQQTQTIREIVHPSFVLEDNEATQYSLAKQFRIKKGWRKKVDRVRLRIQYRTWNI